MDLDEPSEVTGRPAGSMVEIGSLELPVSAERIHRPQLQRGLMDLPHEIILRIIDEVILGDRATGRDQIRAHSATYALSRTSAYWQEEVENRHRVLYLETSLFPGFARWSMHSDWLFRKNRFSPSDSPISTVTASRESEPGLAIVRPKTQASTFALTVPDFQKSDGQESESTTSTDKMSVSSSSTYSLSGSGSEGGLDCSALSISGSKKSFVSTLPTPMEHSYLDTVNFGK